MNRYTFKAKRKDNGEWVYGYYVELPKINAMELFNGGYAEDTACYIVINKNRQHPNFPNSNPIEVVISEQYEIIPETLCQWLFNYKNNDYYENDLIEVIGEIDNGLETYEDRGILTLKLNKEYFNTPALYDEKDNNNLCLEDVFSDEYGLEYNNLGNKFDKEVE